MKYRTNRYLPIATILTSSLLGITTLSYISLTILGAFAIDNAVDDISITVPSSCSLTPTLDSAHTETINIGTNATDIGTTTIKVFCNDSEGFAIYAAGYTGDEIGGTNSNKLIGTNNQTSIGNIDTGIATSGATSNWSMKLIKVENEQGEDPVAYNPANLTIESDTNGSFANYHVVPNEYTKVASFTSTTDATLGSVLQTTYQAYISPTQAAGTYAGKVIYTLVHPATAIAPVHPDQIGVNYNANGSSFTGGATTNSMVYTINPMYIATTPEIVTSSNVGSDSIQDGAYGADEIVLTPITASGASKMKIVLRYGLSEGTFAGAVQGVWDGDLSNEPEVFKIVGGESNGSATFVFEGDTVTVGIMNYSGTSPTTGYDYGIYAEVYPLYATEQPDTERTSEYISGITPTIGTYATTTNWYGSWYADINGVHYDFMDESEVISFLNDNRSTLSGTTIDLMRGLTFTEAYTRANKSEDGGYYKQQELTKSMCNTIAITQNQTVKDVRDNNTYMVGKLKDGNCWMLNNLALDPTDSTTAQNMSASNTNATAEAIANYLTGGNSNNIPGWSSVAVANTGAFSDFFFIPVINNADKDTLATTYGPAAINGQAKVGIEYNFCAATVGTFCYEQGQGVDVPDTLIDAPQDLCPANWRMPTGGYREGDYYALFSKYDTTTDASNPASIQYNLSIPLPYSWGTHLLSSTCSSSSTGDCMVEELLVDPSYASTGHGSSRNVDWFMRCLVSE